MTDREINEIRAAIKYMDMKPSALSKFFEIKELLLEEIINDPSGYKVDSIFPNPLNDNKIVKCVNILNAKYTASLTKSDFTSSDSRVPEAAEKILKNITVSKDTIGSVFLSFNENDIKDCDVYVNIPRGNSFTMKNVSLNNLSLQVMGAYNTYVTEGFTLCVRTKSGSDDLWVAIEPSAIEGVKGLGEVYVYVRYGGSFYRDLADKYFNIDEILSVFKG